MNEALARMDERFSVYTGTAKARAALAATNNYASRTDISNAGGTSYFANLGALAKIFLSPSQKDRS